MKTKATKKPVWQEASLPDSGKEGDLENNEEDEKGQIRVKERPRRQKKTKRR